MTPSALSPPNFDRLQQRALMVGIGGLVLCLIGFFVNATQFFHAYLLGYLFWLGIALGCLAILMLHHLVGGAWGAVIQRVLEAGTRTLPLMAVLFLPLLYGLHDLYAWSRPDVVANDAMLQHKSAYLNPAFFVLRAMVYFAIWITAASLLNTWSQQHEQAQGQPAERAIQRRLIRLSGPGLGLYALTITFASIDWAMSLEPHWYSTIYGVLFMVSQILSTLAFAIIALARLATFEPYAAVVSPQHFHDLGNLLLAFVMLWAYMAFSQFLIIWSGNLAEEIPWYLHRTQGGWEWIAVLLLVFHFALPFFVLLSRTTKRTAQILTIVAVALLCMHLLDLFWLLLPALHPTGLRLHVLDILAPIGVGGLWVAIFIRHLKGRVFLPLHDARLQGVTEHE